jgi:hypothetical protein
MRAAQDTDHDGEISFEEFTYAVLHAGAFLEGVETHELLEHLEKKPSGPKSFAQQKSAMFTITGNLVYANTSTMSPSKAPPYATGLHSAGSFRNPGSLELKAHGPTPGNCSPTPVPGVQLSGSRVQFVPQVMPPGMLGQGSPFSVHMGGASQPSAPALQAVSLQGSPAGPSLPLSQSPASPHVHMNQLHVSPQPQSRASPHHHISYSTPDRYAARLHNNYYNQTMSQAFVASPGSPAGPPPHAFSTQTSPGPHAQPVYQPQSPNLSLPGSPVQFMPVQLSTHPVGVSRGMLGCCCADACCLFFHDCH